MRNLSKISVVVCMAALLGSRASAHEFDCVKQVGIVAADGTGAPVAPGGVLSYSVSPRGMLEISQYPSLVAFEVKLTNLADAPSVILSATDTMTDGRSGAIVFGDPFDPGTSVAVGGSATRTVVFSIPTYEACVALASGALDVTMAPANACKPHAENRFVVTHEVGQSECRAQIFCKPPPPPPPAAKAEVQKVTQPAGFEPGWSFTLKGPGLPEAGETVITNGTGFMPFTSELKQSGTYEVSEAGKAGWNLVSVNGDATKTTCTFSVSFPADAGKTFSCTFTNQKPPSARVKKITVPAGSEAGWQFTLTGPGIAPAGEVATTAGAAYVDFASVLQAGTYTVTETAKPGWGIQAVNGDATKTTCQFTVALPANAGATFSCDFTNVEHGKLEVIKTESGAVPVNDWPFALFAGTTASDAAKLEAHSATSVNSGHIAFTTALDPSQKYTLCELEVLPGWAATWMLNGAAVTPVQTTYAGTDRNLCLTFGSGTAFPIAASATLAFAIDNHPPPQQACETAFGYGGANLARCFIDDGFDRWGWTNGLIPPNTTTVLDVYAGAGQCDLSKGTKVGTVTVVYDGATAVVTYQLIPGYVLDETHLYIGSAKYPQNNGTDTVAPGQYPYIHDPAAGGTDTFTVTGLSGSIYVIAHAITCGGSILN